MIESLLKPLKKIFFREMITSSGGSSIVINEEFVLQKFINPSVSDKIVFYISRLKPVKIHLLFRKGYGTNKIILLDRFLEYNPFSYIPSIIRYNSSIHTITWSRITPLNSEPNKLLSSSFLLKNYLKICYDVSKALYSLKSIGLIHNDTRLDNIGIYKGNFVLFDFDGSGTPEQKCKDYIDDYKDLLISFKFYDVVLPEKMELFTGINSLIQITTELGFSDSLNNSVTYLEKLEIK